MSRAKFEAARELIQEKCYDEARAILLTIDHPKADDWLTKLDEIAPPAPQPQMRVPLKPPLSPHYAAQPSLQPTAQPLHAPSFTGKAVLTFVLYWFAFLPGLIANNMFYAEARRAEDAVGYALPGVGALLLMKRMVFVFLLLFLGAAVLFALYLSRF